MSRSSVITKLKVIPKVTTGKKVAAKKVARKSITRSKKAPAAKAVTIAQIAKNITPTPTIKRNPLGHLLIEKILREAGFRGGISSSKTLLDTYSTDESIFNIRPQVVIQPKNRQDVEIATGVIAEQTKRFDSLSLTPRAAGTGLSGGSLTDSIVIDVCAHLNKIGDIIEKKDKITFSCEPGAMWRDVEKKLKAHGAYLPPYPAAKEICSVGGSIANNSAGPDSLRHGHCADWVESMDVVLQDGHTYTIKPLTLREFKLLIKQDHEHARITRDIFALIVKNEKEIKKNQPITNNSNAGYPLWSVLPQGVTKFKKEVGVFDLTRLISGSQGTIGIITNVTLRALPIPKKTTLLVLPIFDLEDATDSIVKALKFNPINVEIFDGTTFDLALRNPNFFKSRIEGHHYYRVMLSMYTLYHVRFRRKTPEFTVLITLDEDTTSTTPAEEIAATISSSKAKARVVRNPVDVDMFWQIRRASYNLAKFQDTTKRPAAFLEDVTIPPENISKFFIQIKRLLKEFNVTATIHGHGSNGHFNFYPLLDFTNKTTPALIEKMSEKFLETTLKFHGKICGEDSDGILRTSHLSKLFSKNMIELFKATEAIFDPADIFNPGKKVHPRYDVKKSIRTQN
ncbi:MAG: hypothetical protein RLZZ230_487 [Candidatus Parcubacteria bacterium]|jgi:FAD/FMN-containing dehydrogenase